MAPSQPRPLTDSRTTFPAQASKLKSETRSLDAVTDDAGEYLFKDLLPSAYTLEVSVQGFKTATKTFSVRAGETSVENISMVVADVTATVTVTSADAVSGIQTNETAPAVTIKQERPANVAAAKRAVARCAAVGAGSGAWTRWANQHERCTRQPKRDDRQQRERD